MKLTRRIPSALLAPMFITGGWDAAVRPKGKAGKASVVTEKVIENLGVATDTEQLVRINGSVQVAAGVMLAAGILPRVAAATLAGSLVPTTLAGHRFWAEEDPQVRVAQRIQFLKNLAMFGGLLLVVAGAEPGFVERHRHSADD
jgi:putative oxidoreductase